MKKSKNKENLSENLRVGVRLSDSDRDKLDYLAGVTGENRSEIVRKGIQMVYNLTISQR